MNRIKIVHHYVTVYLFCERFSSFERNNKECDPSFVNEASRVTRTRPEHRGLRYSEVMLVLFFCGRDPALSQAVPFLSHCLALTGLDVLRNPDHSSRQRRRRNQQKQLCARSYASSPPPPPTLPLSLSPSVFVSVLQSQP